MASHLFQNKEGSLTTSKSRGKFSLAPQLLAPRNTQMVGTRNPGRFLVTSTNTSQTFFCLVGNPLTSPSYQSSSFLHTSPNDFTQISLHQN